MSKTLAEPPVFGGVRKSARWVWGAVLAAVALVVLTLVLATSGFATEAQQSSELPADGTGSTQPEGVVTQNRGGGNGEQRHLQDGTCQGDGTCLSQGTGTPGESCPNGGDQERARLHDGTGARHGAGSGNGAGLGNGTGYGNGGEGQHHRAHHGS